MKTHLNLATTDLGKSVEFYSVLFEARPVKDFGDYALFVIEQPGLELALNLSDSVSPAKDVHYGVKVETVEDVERAIARLHRVGLVASIERDETCCYASQTKVWTVDPEGRRWEVYTVREESVDRDSPDAACCAAKV
jgi:catechol 2,3-dioxygenase-like lactoylglutathione lyase family enzyme